MSWIFLFFAGLFEIGWAIGLKYTDGFSKPLPTLLTIASMIVSLGLLGLALKTLPVGMIAFEQSHNTDYPALLAGLALISVPTLLAYAIFNKQVIRGVVAGAVK